MSVILPLLLFSVMMLSTGLDSGVLRIFKCDWLVQSVEQAAPTSPIPRAKLTGSHMQREKGSERRIYCWVLTCTHSWCCFSPLGPSAIPKASKTTACQVVTAGFKQLLLQCYSEVPSHTDVWLYV